MDPISSRGIVSGYLEPRLKAQDPAYPSQDPTADLPEVGGRQGTLPIPSRDLSHLPADAGAFSGSQLIQEIFYHQGHFRFAFDRSF